MPSKTANGASIVPPRHGVETHTRTHNRKRSLFESFSIGSTSQQPKSKGAPPPIMISETIHPQVFPHQHHQHISSYQQYNGSCNNISILTNTNSDSHAHGIGYYDFPEPPRAMPSNPNKSNSDSFNHTDPNLSLGALDAALSVEFGRPLSSAVEQLSFSLDERENFRTFPNRLRKPPPHQVRKDAPLPPLPRPSLTSVEVLDPDINIDNASSIHSATPSSFSRKKSFKLRMTNSIAGVFSPRSKKPSLTASTYSQRFDDGNGNAENIRVSGALEGLWSRGRKMSSSWRSRKESEKKSRRSGIENQDISITYTYVSRSPSPPSPEIRPPSGLGQMSDMSRPNSYVEEDGQESIIKFPDSGYASSLTRRPSNNFNLSPTLTVATSPTLTPSPSFQSQNSVHMTYSSKVDSKTNFVGPVTLVHPLQQPNVRVHALSFSSQNHSFPSHPAVVPVRPARSNSNRAAPPSSYTETRLSSSDNHLTYPGRGKPILARSVPSSPVPFPSYPSEEPKVSGPTGRTTSFSSRSERRNSLLYAGSPLLCTSRHGLPSSLIPILGLYLPRASLAILARCNRSYLEAARFSLYSAISSGTLPRPSARRALLRSLAHSPTLACHVRVLAWDCRSSSLSSSSSKTAQTDLEPELRLLGVALPLMSRLHTLALTHPQPAILRAVTRTKRLRSLAVAGAASSAASTALAELLSRQPSLRNLSLPDVFHLPLESPQTSTDKEPHAEIVPMLTTISLPSSLVTSLAPSRPLYAVRLHIVQTLVEGLAPRALLSSVAQCSSDISEVCVRVGTGGRVDGRTVGRVLGAVAAEGSDTSDESRKALRKVQVLGVVGWGIREADELYSQVTRVLARFGHLRALRLSADPDALFPSPFTPVPSSNSMDQLGAQTLLQTQASFADLPNSAPSLAGLLASVGMDITQDVPNNSHSESLQDSGVDSGDDVARDEEQKRRERAREDALAARWVRLCPTLHTVEFLSGHIWNRNMR